MLPNGTQCREESDYTHLSYVQMLLHFTTKGPKYIRICTIVEKWMNFLMQHQDVLLLRIPITINSFMINIIPYKHLEV